MLLTLAAALAGCSAIKLGYNTLGDVAYWWLDSYIDFTEAQRPLVRQDLARLHAWHRAEELPRFAELLHQMEEMAPGEVSPQQACAFVPEFRQRIAAVTQRAEPAIVALAVGLSAEQLAHINHKYDKNNASYTADWVKLPPAQLRQKRYRQFLDRSEMIYGRLDEPQREALRLDVERSTFDPRRILAERQRRQQDALRTLRQMSQPRTTLAEARQLWHASLERALVPPDRAARAYQDALIEEGCRHFSVLHNSTTAAQREAAVRRLRAYQRDLRDLAAQPQ